MTSEQLHKFDFDVTLIVKSCDGQAFSEMVYQLYCFHCLSV